MIFITQNGDSGQVHAKRYPPTGTPENTAVSYTVSKRGAEWEVRRLRRVNGKLASERLVASFPTEQLADAHASGLANPEFARQRGRRVLEELIEEAE